MVRTVRPTLAYLLLVMIISYFSLSYTPLPPLGISPHHPLNLPINLRDDVMAKIKRPTGFTGFDYKLRLKNQFFSISLIYSALQKYDSKTLDRCNYH